MAVRPRILAVTIGLMMMVSSSPSAQADLSCAFPQSFDDPHPVLHDGRKTMFWVRPLEVNADGARNAYHRDDPHGNKGLAIEYIGNGMTISRGGKAIPFNPEQKENSEWLDAYWRIVRNDWKAPRGLEVDIYGFARGENDNVCMSKDGRLIAATSLVQHPTARLCNPKRYVNALQIPGIVVPNRSDDEPANSSGDPEVAPPFAKRGVRRGDLAIVYNPETQVWKGAVIYDTGPRHLLGEGSLRLVLDLRKDTRTPTSAFETNALGIEETYTLVFPGTSRSIGPGATWTREKLQALAEDRFKNWGGGSVDQAVEKLVGCAARYKSRFHSAPDKD